jgi:hypothetical protein
MEPGDREAGGGGEPDGSLAPALLASQSASATGPAPSRSELDIFIRVSLALFVIAFMVWLSLAWGGYARSYAGALEPWHRGGRNFVELTLVSEDRSNLACAANAAVAGLHCGFDAGGAPSPMGDADDRHVLRPYNTVNGQLFLGAGLWSSPALAAKLPAQRFTVWCDLEVAGALRSVALRWAPRGTFAPVDKSLAVGELHDCAIPE